MYIYIGNVQHVHHMVLYGCHESVVNMDDIIAEKTHCRNYTGGCYEPLYVFAVGADQYSFPENVGMPFSSNASLGYYRYVVLEIHYDNPNQLPNVKDYSGVTIYYTDQVREHDAGILLFGIGPNTKHVIPSGMANAISYAFCGSECLNENYMGFTEVNIFASMLHTHSRGKTARVRQIRNNIELSPIDENLNYDPDFQAFTPINNRTLKSDDKLIIECYFDTTSQTGITFGGLGGKEEMCIVFLAIWPAMNVKTIYMTKASDTWINESITKGYLSSEYPYQSLVDDSNTEFTDFYNEYWMDFGNRFSSYNQYCRVDGVLHVNSIQNISNYFTGFEAYQDNAVVECFGNDDNHSGSFINMYLNYIIVLFAYFFFVL